MVKYGVRVRAIWDIDDRDDVGMTTDEEISEQYADGSAA